MERQQRGKGQPNLTYSVIIAFLLGLVSFVLQADTPGYKSNPKHDRKVMIDYFQERFPEILLSDYVFGALAFSKDGLRQYESIMDFPPFTDKMERGREIWETPFSNGSSFSKCFPQDGIGAASKYPSYDEEKKMIITFEKKINDCLISNGEEPFSFNDGDSMGLVSLYGRSLSDGYPTNVSANSEGAKASYFKGKAIFFQRMGQLNLSCASCHITNAGKIFRDEYISPALGHTAHFPVFRGGEFLFTLHMRYQRCMEAMRATPYTAGSPQLNRLEFFHSFLSNGLPIKAGVYRK